MRSTDVKAAALLPPPARRARERPRISVVVCAWSEERLGLLEENIASLERQTLPPAEVIVAVDHNPELLAVARDAFPDHLVVANREPRGASGPKNTALLHASGEIVAFIDDDAFADERWLEALAEAYEDETTIGTGGRLTPIWMEGRPPWFPPEFDWVVGCSYRGEAVGRTAVRNPIGANMSFRRDVFARTG
ncbi:MAG: glycosyltransferase, partial [Actinomycetota bacterium]|nr:glycosyltransferase [Actinomycetota bacterium]